MMKERLLNFAIQQPKRVFLLIFIALIVFAAMLPKIIIDLIATPTFAANA
jgi:hypothetical protein